MSRLSTADAIKLLEGKSVTFFGDSVARNLYYSYARALGDADSSGHNGTAPRHADIHAGFKSPTGGANGQLGFLWAPYATNATARLKAMAGHLKGGEGRPGVEQVVVISTGLWDALNVRSEAQFGTDLVKLSQAIADLKFAASSSGGLPATVVWLKVR